MPRSTCPSLAVACLLAAVALSPAPAAAQAPWTEPLDVLLRARVEAGLADSTAGTPRIEVGAEVLHSTALVARFYEGRDYQPGWVLDDLENAQALLRSIRRAELEGLRSRDYHLRRLEDMMQALIALRIEGGAYDPRLLVDLDLLLTDAFLIYGTHLLVGRVDPVAIDPEWVANRRTTDLVEVLETALAYGLVEGSLADLLPPYIEYRALRDALALYRRIEREGGWPRLEEGGTMRPGNRGPRIADLRARLSATRDLSQRARRDDRYDADVEQAVRRFQDRHGLDVTGIVDLQTLAELAAPVEQRIEQLIVNMERWRWLPEDLGARHARVNIAGFDFRVYEGATEIMTMRAMVGHQYRRTPFSATPSRRSCSRRSGTCRARSRLPTSCRASWRRGPLTSSGTASRSGRGGARRRGSCLPRRCSGLRWTPRSFPSVSGRSPARPIRSGT